MTKKLPRAGQIPDLFANLDLPEDESEKSEPRQDESVALSAQDAPVASETQPAQVPDEPADQPQEEQDAPGEAGEVSEAEQVRAVNAAQAALPAVLMEQIGPVDDDELTLARYAAKAYLEYALSVVKSRALPDIFDGMKPVQRRILYAMDRMHLAFGAKHVKSARVVGDVLGKYHPHGDQAAYDAMVRMAQDFSLRYPLVDGHGNFGSRDGDGPAAMRYTEARLTRMSELLLSELDTEDVEFVPNYDGSFKEPEVLPARMPFVLLNGASGIAVGMATEIPPHNFNEVGNALLRLLDNPDSSLEQVMQDLPGPDFPGGGQIISSASDIRDVYSSGRGSLRVRARYHFEELQRNQWQLVIDELPPAASAEGVLAQIEDITNPKPRAGKKTVSADQQQAKAAMLSILDRARNECSKDVRMRLVFEPKSSKVSRDLLVNALLTQTSLECNAPVNLVMIGADGRPQQKGLLTILNEWIDVRLATVRRRSVVRLGKVRARLHILEGRCIAIDNIDRVIEIVRFDPDPKARLMQEFNLSAQQAEDILDLRLRQLANLEFDQVRAEMVRLEEEANTLARLIESERLQRAQVARETREAMKKYGDERRTLIEEARRAVLEQITPNEPVTIVISEKGYLRSRGGHGHDAALMNFKMGDSLKTSIECMSEDTLIAVGNNGRVYSIAVSDLPPARGDGLPLSSFIDQEANTEIVSFIAGPAKTPVVFATDDGYGLACQIGNLTARVKSGKAFVNVSEGAGIITASLLGSEKYMACLSEKGRLLVFELTELRKLAGGGKGVILMGLETGEKLIAALPVVEAGVVVTGQGATVKREKTLVRGAFAQHIGRRARKGRDLEVRFHATGLRVLESVAESRSEESDDEQLDLG